MEAGAQPQARSRSPHRGVCGLRPPRLGGRQYLSRCRQVQDLILRWNGTGWKQVSAPTPAGGPALLGVAAVSARSAWAVGVIGGNPYRTLILHWNGTAWRRVPSPSPGSASNDVLYGVAATSARNAWAVGTIELQQDPDPALERQDLEAGAQPQPRRQSLAHPPQRDRRLGTQRLGSRLQQRQDPDRALERHHMEAGAQPEPSTRQLPIRRGRRLCPQRLGGRRHLPQRPPQDADHALERHSMEVSGSDRPLTRAAAGRMAGNGGAAARLVAFALKKKKTSASVSKEVSL